MNVAEPARKREGVPGRGRDDTSAAEIFRALWDSLADLMGNPAVAAILKKALRLAAMREPELRGIEIRYEELEYKYALPDSWQKLWNGQMQGVFRTLMGELGPLLAQLTGPVAVRRLERLPLLQEKKIITSSEVQEWLKK